MKEVETLDQNRKREHNINQCSLQMHRRDKVVQSLMEDTQTDPLLWTTKYFPHELDDVPMFRKTQIENFIRIFDNAFVGPPWHPRLGMVVGPVGCGKTTLIKAVCKAKDIEIVQFSPDDDYDKPMNGDDDPIDYGNDSPLLNALKVFLERAQLVTVPGMKQLVLIDDFSVDRCERRRFIQILEDYGTDRRRLFPLFWITDPDGAIQKPQNCVVFNFPAASITVLKRVVKRVCNSEGIKLTNEQLDEVLAGNPGDVRLAINQLQLSRNFSTGSYTNLSFFQAIGEVIYNKQKRSSEDILVLSHCPPRMMITALYENALEYFEDIDDYAQAADYLSEADVLMSESWQQPSLGIVAATTAMRGIMSTNRHRTPNAFVSLRPSKMYRLRSVKRDPESEYECWPSKDMKPEHMDFRLFHDQEQMEYVSSRYDNRMLISNDKLIVTDQELAEAMEILEDDPIVED